MQEEPVNTSGQPVNEPRGGPRLDDSRTVIAVALIVIGVVALLGTVGWLPQLRGLMGGLLFAAVGVLLLWLARRYANDWLMFAAFPAFGLAFAAAVPGDLGGAGFLAGIGAGFLALVVAEPRRWWAIIPAGVLFTLSVITWSSLGEPGGGTIFFLGLAATFAVVWRNAARPQPWAVYPAIGTLAMAMIVSLARADWLVPVLLIVIGAGLILRAQLERRSSPGG